MRYPRCRRVFGSKSNWQQCIGFMHSGASITKVADIVVESFLVDSTLLTELSSLDIVSFDLSSIVCIGASSLDASCESLSDSLVTSDSSIIGYKLSHLVGSLVFSKARL